MSSAASHPGRAIRQAADTVRAFAKLAPAAWPATGSSLSGPIGKERRFTWAQASLDDVKLIKRELGGTVNDVVLAAISGGFRALLLARGGSPGRTWSARWSRFLFGHRVKRHLREPGLGGAG